MRGLRRLFSITSPAERVKLMAPGIERTQSYFRYECMLLGERTGARHPF
jgi:hypothetical protein